MKWSCDFETTTDPNDCRVWAWIAIDIDDTDRRIFGNDINSFMKWLFSHGKDTMYFHNLKFDSAFILYWLMDHAWSQDDKSHYLKYGKFSTLISDKGQFYSLRIGTHIGEVEIRDSFKLLPFSVDNIAKSFHLPISKLKIDYNAKREIGHQLTREEKLYITNDALIVALALSAFFAAGYNKMTIGSNAFNFYVKNTHGGKKKFRKVFPVPNNDEYIRASYKGGFTYAAPQYKGKMVSDGLVFDVNSLYPSVLHSPYTYPYGEPVYYEGKYAQDDDYPLYVQRIECMFTIKPNHIPTIQIKNSPSYDPTEYLLDSGAELVVLTLTSVDLALFLEHYDTECLTYIDGYKYRAKSGMFDEYIDYWYNEKNKAKREKNNAQYVIAKLFLNNLYGKFSTNPNCNRKIPYVCEYGELCFTTTTSETREAVYIPVGTFCTAYARNVTIRAAQAVYDRFMYADTDSLHLYGLEMPTNIDVDDYKLGAFKCEGVFDKAKYLGAKLYMEHLREPNEPIGSEQWKITGAGMTDAVKAKVTPENFAVGFTTPTGKLRPKQVAGGVVLVDTPFTIKEKMRW